MLSIIGPRADRTMTWDFCPPGEVEIKCPGSMNFTSSKDENIWFPYIKEDMTINKQHKYYTQSAFFLYSFDIYTIYKWKKKSTIPRYFKTYVLRKNWKIEN